MVIILGFVTYFLSASGFITELMLLISLFVGISVAAALDDSKNLDHVEMGRLIIAEFKPALYVAFLFIISIYFIYFVRFCFTEYFKNLLYLLYNPMHFSKFTFSNIYEPSVRHLIFTLLYLMITGWFIYPLTVLHSAGIYSGFILSLESFEVNFLPMGLFSFIIIAPIVVIREAHLTIFYPFCNIFASAYIYVAYRDVFLGEAKNKALATEETRLTLNILTPVIQK
jgi:hypothetical protein